MSGFAKDVENIQEAIVFPIPDVSFIANGKRILMIEIFNNEGFTSLCGIEQYNTCMFNELHSNKLWHM